VPLWSAALVGVNVQDSLQVFGLSTPNCWASRAGHPSSVPHQHICCCAPNRRLVAAGWLVFW